MVECLKNKSKLKTNSFHKERPNTQHYYIVFCFGQKLFKNIPLPLCQTMSSLVGLWQISSTSCHQSLQFFNAVTISYVSSSTLDLSIWSLFSVSYTLSFLCFLQGMLALAIEKLEDNKKKTQLSLVWSNVIDCWLHTWKLCKPIW
jgi:hypothetical protein